MTLSRAVDETSDRRRVVALEDPDADAVFDALGAETRRALLARLGEAPATASALAAALDTSLQTVTYHLDRLVAAGLVEAVGSRYSAKGRKMDVYAPTGVVVCTPTGGDPAATDAASDAPPRPIREFDQSALLD
jgi:DNA-binding transcriptional ArsR family regulator